MAEFEQKSIVARTKMGMLRKAQTGKWPGGSIPLGYRLTAEKDLEIDEGEAAFVRQIFEIYTKENEGSGSISKRMNMAGYRTKKGKKFTRKSILRILRNPFYLGRFRWQQEEFEGDHEPIISEATFNAAKLILDKRSAESPGKRLINQSQRILTGLIRCGKCGSKMFGVSANARGKKFEYYACRKRLETSECDQDYVRADLIEEQILAEIQTIFQNEALLEEIWESAQKKLAANAPSIDEDLKLLNQQRTKSQATLDRYFAAFEAGTMTPDVCNKRVEEVSNQITQLDEQRQALQDKRSALDLPALKTDFLQEILSNLRGVVKEVPAPQ